MILKTKNRHFTSHIKVFTYSIFFFLRLSHKGAIKDLHNNNENTNENIQKHNNKKERGQKNLEHKKNTKNSSTTIAGAERNTVNNKNTRSEKINQKKKKRKSSRRGRDSYRENGNQRISFFFFYQCFRCTYLQYMYVLKGSAVQQKLLNIYGVISLVKVRLEIPEYFEAWLNQNFSKK